MDRNLIGMLLAASMLAAQAATAPLDLPLNLPDPLRPDGYATEAGAPAADGGLRAIRITPVSRSAVIDGRTVHIGARVGNQVVTDIRPNVVELTGQGGRKLLHLSPHTGGVERARGETP
jgi:hypothetical protein